MKKLSLHWQILIALALAAVVGSILNQGSADAPPSEFLGIAYITIFEYIGNLFLNALKMIIVPLILSSIIVGVAGMGASMNLKSIGIRTLSFYAITTLLAILIGLSLINLVSPGYIDGQPAGELLALSNHDVAAIEQRIEGRGAGDVAGIFTRMVPPNIIKAAAEGQMLGLIFFAILFGYFMTKLPVDLKDPFFRFWSAMFQVMMSMTEWIMKFAPIGVLAWSQE